MRCHWTSTWRYACVLRALHWLTRLAFEAHPGTNTFPPEADSLLWSHTSSGPSASRNTFSVSTITDGNARIGSRSSFPALTLAWLHIEPSPCGGVRPAGDPVGAVFFLKTIPTLDRALTREPTVVSRLSCRPPHLNVDRFHQPCLFP